MFPALHNGKQCLIVLRPHILDIFNHEIEMAVKTEKFSDHVWKSTLQPFSWWCLKNSVHDLYFFLYF